MTVTGKTSPREPGNSAKNLDHRHHQGYRELRIRRPAASPSSLATSHRRAASSNAAPWIRPCCKHTGPARVFDSEEEAIEAIYDGKIVKGDVVVIRYEGPKGGPGMREMLNPTSALAGMRAGQGRRALITDGRFSGATQRRGHRPRLSGGGRHADRSPSSAKARTDRHRHQRRNDRSAGSSEEEMQRAPWQHGSRTWSRRSRAAGWNAMPVWLPLPMRAQY